VTLVQSADHEELGRELRKLPYAPEEGIYLQSEAAVLAGLPPSTMRFWLERVRAVPQGVAPTDRPLVSFLELTSLRAIAALRKLGMRPAAIRRGLEGMREHLGIDYPFASDELKTDGVHLYFPEADRLIAVDHGNQLTAQVLVDSYLVDVRYAPVSARLRLATSWEPPGVSLNPRVQRGAPCVSGTRIQVAILRRFADAGDSPELLAEMYDLTTEQIEQALRWSERIKRQAA
jgi:uncharacterized protein (DUF433 family)